MKGEKAARMRALAGTQGTPQTTAAQAVKAHAPRLPCASCSQSPHVQHTAHTSGMNLPHQPIPPPQAHPDHLRLWSCAGIGDRTELDLQQPERLVPRQPECLVPYAGHLAEPHALPKQPDQ